MEKNPHITSTSIRLYTAIASAVGRETADRLFPHVTRFLARLDAGVRGTGQLSDPEE